MLTKAQVSAAHRRGELGGGSPQRRHPPSINNPASLLQATNRLAEAEPLMYLMLRSLGTEHPSSYTVRENYVGLLQAMGKTEDEIKENITYLLRQR